MRLAQKITPFLWFDNNALEAAEYYVSIFDNSKVLEVLRCGDAGPGPKGSVLTTTFQLAGQQFIALNGGPIYQLNEAFSLFVNCDSQAEVDEYWEQLVAGGQAIQCGWLKDKFGLCWQVAPAKLGEWMRDPDPVKAGRVMQAMMQMVKLDLDRLQAAYEGE
jgi:predicted 3-demethylubiquinone-9 3-methyltransferase (glyoxalase superfamily)